MRGSQTCVIKWCVKWRFWRNLVICIFLWNKRIFCQKNYPVVLSCPSLSTMKIWAKTNFRPLPSYFPFFWTGTLKQFTIVYQGPRIWNSLPLSITSSTSFSSLRKNIVSDTSAQRHLWLFDHKLFHTSSQFYKAKIRHHQNHAYIRFTKVFT